MNISLGRNTQVLFCFLLLPAVARLQPVPFLGTKTPYPAPAKNKITAAPAGYHPVFINYTGRHGSRFMTKPGADVEVVQLLTLAEKQNALTQLGMQVKMMAERFLLLQKAGYENITLLGAEEQEAIGNRIFHNYQQAFGTNGIDILMTYKVRTQQSADGFLKGLSTYQGEKRKTIVPEGQDDILRFYDLSPAYQDFKKSSLLTKRLDSLITDSRTANSVSNICSKIFTPDFVKKLISPGINIEIKGKTTTTNAIVFAQNLYELYTMQFSLPVEMQQKGYKKTDIDFSSAFEKSDLAWLDTVSGAQDFLEKGAGLDTLGIQVKVATPLLVDYIKSIQKKIDGKIKSDGIFRFTHAEAISPFATLSGIREASIPGTSVFTYAEGWHASSIIPLSANICWIVYYNGKDYLVKITLNEKEVALPVPTKTFPFYKWTDISNYYTRKMKSLGIDLTTDMHQYLLELR